MVVKPIDAAAAEEIFFVDWDGDPTPTIGEVLHPVETAADGNETAPGATNCRLLVWRGGAVGVVAGGAIGEYWLCA